MLCKSSVPRQNNTDILSVNGGWGEWTSWTTCGEHNCRSYRFRGCVHPYPANGGRNCVGDDNQYIECDFGNYKGKGRYEDIDKMSMYQQ